MDIRTFMLSLRSMTYDIEKTTFFKRNIHRVYNVTWSDLVDILKCYSNDYYKLIIINSFISIIANKINLRMRAYTVKLILHSISDETIKYTAHRNIFPYVNMIC